MSRIRRHLTFASGGVKASLKLHCPSGLRRASDICFEDSVRSGDLTDALKTCADVGRRLPSASELALVFEHLAAAQDAQWVSVPYLDHNGDRVHPLWDRTRRR